VYSLYLANEGFSTPYFYARQGCFATIVENYCFIESGRQVEATTG